MTAVWLVLGVLGLLVVVHLWRTAPLAIVAGMAAWIWGTTYWHDATAAIVVGVVAGVAAYLLLAFQHPRQDCLWCGNNAKRRDGTGWNHRWCFWCGGRGWKLRWGARLRSRYRDGDDD